MADEPLLDAPDENPNRKWIPRETWRQEKAVVFVREALHVPHVFMAHDRAKAGAALTHLWQAKRGVRKGTPDTQLILAGRHYWFEFKAPGKKVADGDDQDLLLQKLRSLGDAAAWGVTIEELRLFYVANGVPLVANAAYLALHYDGMVDSRIAKEEARQAGCGVPKKAASGSGRARAGTRWTVKQGMRAGAWNP